MSISLSDLERVFLRVINAETDEQFTDILSRALVPVLCALKDPGYATKVERGIYLT